MAATAILIWLHSSRWQSLLRRSAKLGPHDEETVRRSRDKSGLALAGIVALGVIVMAFLPLYYTNLTLRPNGTIRVRPVPDVFLHVAIANELTHTVPPQPGLFGTR
jgi:hypothetical protein